MTPQTIANELRTLIAAANAGLDNEHRDRQILLETLIDGVDQLVTRIDTNDTAPMFCPRCQHRTAVHDGVGCRGCACFLSPKSIADLAKLAARRAAQPTGGTR